MCGLSCSTACGIVVLQPGSNLRPLLCKPNSLPGKFPSDDFASHPKKSQTPTRPSRMCILTSSSWPHKPRRPVEQSSSEAQQLFPWRETLFSRTPTNYSLTSLRPFLKSLQCIPPLPCYLKLHSLLSAILLCFIFLYHTDHGQRNYNCSILSDPLWLHGL